MMDSSEAVFDGLKDAGIDLIVSVPCVNLSKILNMIDEDEDIIHIPVTREEEGIGICAGAYLGGKNNEPQGNRRGKHMRTGADGRVNTAHIGSHGLSVL